MLCTFERFLHFKTVFRINIQIRLCKLLNVGFSYSSSRKAMPMPCDYYALLSVRSSIDFLLFSFKKFRVSKNLVDIHSIIETWYEIGSSRLGAIIPFLSFFLQKVEVKGICTSPIPKMNNKNITLASERGELLKRLLRYVSNSLSIWSVNTFLMTKQKTYNYVSSFNSNCNGFENMITALKVLTPN